MISSEHDAGSIGAWLLKYRSFCMMQNRKWPVFQKVISDFSFAILNAVSISFNNLDSKDYSNMTFDHVYNHSEFFLDKIQMHICCSHMSKLMARDVNSHFENPKVISHIKEILAKAYTINDWDDFVPGLKISI